MLKISVFLYLFHASLAYRILVVFPTASFSHQRPQIALSKALAAHGHEVTIISPDPFKTTNPNIRQISVRFLYENIAKNFHKMAVEETSIKQTFNAFKGLSVETQEGIFGNEEVRKLLNDQTQKFDAVLVENIGYVLPLALAEKYNSALIGLTSLEIFAFGHMALGNPAHPLVHSGYFIPRSEHPGLLERIRILYDFWDFYSWSVDFYNGQTAVLKKYFPDVKKSPLELTRRIDFAIECTSPAQGFVRPLLPNTKQIGFIHIEEPKPLPADLQTYLDSSTRGVVYISFGSNVKSINIGHEMMGVLTSVLGSLPFDVLWKYENSSMPNKPSNVKTLTWTPQPDLLAHPNIKLFITQGGLQSMDETMSRGVPVVVIPFFADQEYNAMQMVRLGIGRSILKSEITAQKFREAILEVVGRPRYRNRVIELAKLVRDTPMNATETAVWYVEHAIRNRGASVFKYRGTTIPFYQYYFLDVVLLALATVASASLAAFKVVRFFSGGAPLKIKSQ